MVGRVASWWVCVALAGCVRFGFTADDLGVRDAFGADRGSADVGLAVDAGQVLSDLQPSTIPPAAPFSAPQPVASLNTSGSEDDPTLTRDMLEIYFERDGDIWRATRQRGSDPWGSPAVVTELSSAANETTPHISADGLTVLFCSDRAHAQAKGDLDVYAAIRSSRNTAWSTPEPIPELNTSYTEGGIVATSDLLSVVLTSTRPGGNGGFDLYTSTRPTLSSTWSPPQAIAELNSSDDEFDPWIDQTGTILYLSVGGDIVVSARAATSATFAPPTPLTGINSTSNDGDPWLSDDLKTIYFTSTRAGSFDLYVATR